MRGGSCSLMFGRGPCNWKTTHHSGLTGSVVNQNRTTSTIVRGSASPVIGETPASQTGRELFCRHTQDLLTRSGQDHLGTPLCLAPQTSETLIYNILPMAGQTV